MEQHCFGSLTLAAGGLEPRIRTLSRGMAARHRAVFMFFRKWDSSWNETSMKVKTVLSHSSTAGYRRNSQYSLLSNISSLLSQRIFQALGQPYQILSEKTAWGIAGFPTFKNTVASKQHRNQTLRLWISNDQIQVSRGGWRGKEKQEHYFYHQYSFAPVCPLNAENIGGLYSATSLNKGLMKTMRGEKKKSN